VKDIELPKLKGMAIIMEIKSDYKACDQNALNYGSPYGQDASKRVVDGIASQVGPTPSKKLRFGPLEMKPESPTFSDPQVLKLQSLVKDDFVSAEDAFFGLIGDVRINQANIGTIPDGFGDVWTTLTELYEKVEGGYLLPELTELQASLTSAQGLARTGAAEASSVASKLAALTSNHVVPLENRVNEHSRFINGLQSSHLPNRVTDVTLRTNEMGKDIDTLIGLVGNLQDRVRGVHVPAQPLPVRLPTAEITGGVTEAVIDSKLAVLRADIASVRQLTEGGTDRMGGIDFESL